MRKILLEIDRKLRAGEVLVYDGEAVSSAEVHQLLPDLQEAKNAIAAQSKEIAELKKTIAELAKIVKEK